MATPQQVINDPNFQGLPPQAQHDVLMSVDPNFAALPEQARQDVITHLPKAQQAPTTPSQPTASVSNQPAFGTLPWLKTKFWQTEDKATKALPAVGATVGSMVGSPGGLPGMTAGAAIGGAGGNAAKQLIRRVEGFGDAPTTSMDAAQQIGNEGVTQGALELLTGGLARGAKALAPNMAESALGVTESMRGRGRTIGQTALDQTTGVRPATIAQQSKQQLGNLTAQMEGAVDQATQAGASGSTAPAHQALNDAIAAAPRNARSLGQKLNDLRDVLYLDPQKPTMNYTPNELLEIKRGIGTEIGTWAPEWRNTPAVKQVQQKLYGAIDGELDRLVPGNADINQQISSLIPVKQRAMRQADQAGITQRLANRAAAHTGALAASGIGAIGGYNQAKQQGDNPLLGAAVGGGAGFLLPELATTPTFQMMLARGANAAPQAANASLPFLRFLASQGISPQKPNQR